MKHGTTYHQADSQIFDRIEEGMTVYDSERNDIGTVEAIYYGAVGEKQLTPGIPETNTMPMDPVENTLVADLAHAFDARDQIPQALAERLRYSGYIKIDGGWFGADRYVMPDQITSVDEDGVYLSTKRERLIKE